MKIQRSKTTTIKPFFPTYTPLAAALLVVLGIQPSQAVVSFDAPPVFPATGSNPNSLYSYDLNADGAWDLVWLSSDDNTVSVALNNGSGQFPTRTVYATGLKPVALEVIDINYDVNASTHYYDLAVVNHDEDSVSVLLNNGDGTFKAKVDTPVGHWPVSISADWMGFVGPSFDINKDGKTDLAVSNEGDNTFSVLLGNGDGTFTTKAVPTGGKPGAISVAPLFIDNTDFFDDVIVLRPDDNLVLYYATNGDGTFKDPVPYATGKHPSSISVDWSDFSTHNTLSLFITNEGDNTVSVFKPDEFQTGFQSKIDYSVGQAPVYIPQPDWFGLSFPITLILEKTQEWTRGIDLATVNRDGNSVTTWLNKGGGVWEHRADYATGSKPNSLGMGDFNIDGAADFVVLNGADGNFTELKNNGDATFHKVISHEFATGTGPSAVAKADFNGDGYADLVVANATGNSVSILLGKGDDGLQDKVDITVGQGPSAVTVGDINGDGNVDLAVALAQDNSVVVLIGNGQGTFTATGFRADTATTPSALTLQDVNGDTLLDLIVANSGSNSVSVLLGEGNGNFKSKTDFVVGSAAKALAVADINGDGYSDVAVANSGSNTVSVLLGNGQGSFTKTATDSATGALPQGLVVADFNADSKIDIAVSNMTDNTVTVLLGNGDGSFQAKRDFATGNGPKGIDALDINFDHKPDLVVTNTSANTVSVMENKGDGTFLGKVDFTVDQAPVAVLIGKIDTDIKPDLVVVNHDSNSVHVVPNSTLAGVRLLPAKHLTFGTIGIGGRVNSDISLTNNGTADLVISDIAITPTDNFSQTNNCPGLLKVGESCNFHFAFTAQHLGAHDAVFSFVGSDSTTPHEVTLHGDGTASNADLGLTMTATPSRATVNGLIKYTLEVSNYGPDKASTVTVTDTLPTGGVWFRTEGVPCTQTGNQVACSVGDIEVGAKTTFDVWVAPTVAGKLTNKARVSSVLPDPNLHDNLASRITSIAALNLKTKSYVDLSLGLKGMNGNVGQSISYQALVKNAGPQSASNVTLSIPVPAGASFMSDGSDGACTAVNSNVICQTASLAKAASKNFTIAFSYTAAKAYTLSGKVFATEGDKAIKNNVAQVKTRVR